MMVKKHHYFLHTSLIVLLPPGWAFLEQLCLASIDIGRLDVADVCQALGLLKCAL